MGNGGADIVAGRTASKPVKKRATRRPKRWMSPTASSQSAAVTFSPACHSARFSGSISSAARAAPELRDPVLHDPRRGGAQYRADGRADLGRLRAEAGPVGLGDLVAERGAQPG